MTWTGPRNVALVEELQTAPGVLHVIGKVLSRDCGCWCAIGIRLDTQETTFPVHGCKAHDALARQALRSLGALPPSDRDVMELFAELLDAAIALS